MKGIIAFGFICYTCTYIETSYATSGACDGTVKSRPASERRTLYTMFDSTKESTKSTYDCQWLIEGPIGTPLFLVINYVRVVGNCPDTSLIFYDGDSVSGTVLKEVCGNVTSQVQIPAAAGGHIYVVFKSISGRTKHEFKFTYTSKIEVNEPFEGSNTSKVGIAIAIVLGTVFMGSIFIAATYCSVKTYMRCRNKDPEPSEMTGITNLRTERMREQTLQDNFDDRRLPRLVKGTLSTASTERILTVQQFRDD